MKTTNRFGEPVHVSSFTTWPEASRFARMIAGNVTRFSILGVRAQGDLWVVTYRSRTTAPWQRDPRGTHKAKGVTS